MADKRRVRLSERPARAGALSRLAARLGVLDQSIAAAGRPDLIT